MGTTLRIHTLGSLTIERDGHPITDFDSRKVQALLVYLACTGRTYPRDVLAEFFWEERTQSQALANLRVALTSLRQTVEPFVDISRDAVGLQPDGAVWLDASAFEAQLDAAGTDASLLTESLDLYHGDFLAGFYVDSNAFEDWATRERERLKLRAMDALDTLARGHLAHQDAASGIATANRLLALDPLREETHRLLMELLWHAGQRGKALEQYETLCTLLRDELGVEPTAATTALYQRIRAGESPVPPTDRHAVRGYDLRERIGSGGFGEVYRAFQPVVNREVAIKVIKPEFANHPDFIRRFETEGQLVARLEHPHIVPLYDYWREPGGAFLVMRLLRRSLADRLTHGPLSVSECTRLVEQVAAALTVAHRAGVVHRDVKPANLLLDDEGNAYLTDFGIAKVLGPALQATQEGMLVGSPTYLAPEQVRGDPVEPRADLYSFGVLLFEALTGQPPFADTLTPSQLLYKQLNDPLPSVVDARPDLPPALDSVLQRATAKDPTRRFRDALELAAAFRQAAGPAGLRPSVEVAASLQPRERPDERTWTPADSLVLQRNPYKGLRAFEEADASDFFGREALVEHLLTCLDDDDPLARFLAVVGPSGSGKSSVVKAGLIPALRQGQLPGSEAWFIAELQPGPRPLDRLEVALLRVAATQPPGLMEQLLRDAHGLTRAAEWILPEDATLLLVIDQFEELFTLADDPRRARHLLALLEAAVTDPRGQVRVLLTLRADFYDRPLMVPGFCDLIRQRTEVVVPLTAEELERAISIPAEQVGVRLEPGLAAAMVADVHEQPGALPMLQFALTELFEQRADHTLTLDAYRALGGVEGALAQQAERVFGRLDAGAQAAARQLFLRLVTLGEGSEDTRRRVLQAELLAVGGEGQLMPPVIDAFDRARLLTFDHDPVTRGPTVEVAHEALLREWDRLRAWLDDSRHDIRQQRLLAAAASEWERAAQDRSYLLSGSRLAQFDDWARTARLALTPDEQAFLDASVTEQQRRDARRRTVRTAALSAALIVALVMTILSIFAFGQEQEAQDARATSDANVVIADENAARAQHLALVNGARAALVQGDLDTALALAVAANQGDSSAQAQFVLAEAAYTPGTLVVLEGNESVPFHVAIAPDGRTALSVSHVELLLWDIAPESATFGTVLRRSELQNGMAEYAAISPDGRYALTCGLSVELWDVQLESPTFGTVVTQLAGHSNWVNSVTFSPDGFTALSASDDTTVILWDVNPDSPTFGTALQQFEGHSDMVWGVAFTPDGLVAVSASEDSSVILWDVDPTSSTYGTALHRFEEHQGPVLSVAVSPDGRTFLSGSADTQVLRWSLETYEMVGRFETSGDSVIKKIALSPDGTRAVTVTNGSTIDLWDATDGTYIRGLSGHEFEATGAVFHPNGHMLLSAAADTTLRLWDLDYGAAEGTVPTHLPPFPYAIIRAADTSPDGRTVLMGGQMWNPPPKPETAQIMQTAALMDIATGQEIQRFEGYTEGVSSVSFSPDGARALICGYAGEAMLWNIQTGELLHAFRDLQGPVAMLYSPDGRIAVSVCDECEELVLWDVADGSPAFGHPIRELAGGPDDNYWVWRGPLAFNPTGTLLAAGTSEGTIIFWDVETGSVISRLGGHGGLVYAVAFSPDGQMLLSGARDASLVLWDVATGTEIRRFVDQPGAMFRVEFGPDGRFAYSDSYEQGITQWEVATGESLRRYPPGTGLQILPDGRSFMTVTGATAFMRYRIDTLEELLAWTLENRYVRDLTCAERALYRIEPLCE